MSANVAIEVTSESAACLDEYASISIAFEVDRRVEVQGPARRSGSLALRERRMDPPYVKDYDSLDGGPSTWSERFDLAEWGFFAARIDGEWVGGAAVACDPGLDPLHGEDAAVLWDIRVAPVVRRMGVGAALFGAAEAWAVARLCRRLVVETQDVNVAAVRFYSSQGCVLERVDPGAYAGLPDETRLVWSKALADPSQRERTEP